MIQSGRLPLAGNRYAPFGYAIDIAGLDLTGATMAAQVRVSPDASGPPVAAFVVSPPSISTTSGLTTSSIALSLGEDQMTAMPAGPEQGDPWVGAWDLVVTLQNNSKFVLLAGTFSCIPGVTRNG